MASYVSPGAFPWPSRLSWRSPAIRSTPPRALALGLVNRVVPADRLIEEAVSLAERIAENAPLALRYSKQVVNKAAKGSEDDGWAANDAAVGIVFTSADAMEGPIAFAEKRAPRWTGR